MKSASMAVWGGEAAERHRAQAVATNDDFPDNRQVAGDCGGAGSRRRRRRRRRRRSSSSSSSREVAL